jgi:hypothetical protein
VKKTFFKVALFFVSTIVFVSIVSCMSVDITKIEIEKLEVTLLHNESVINGSSFVPGQVYHIKIKVLAGFKGPIYNPNYNNFIVESPNNSLQVTKKDDDVLEVQASHNVLHLAQSGYYILSIGVKKEPLPDTDASLGNRLEELQKTGLCGKERQ